MPQNQPESNEVKRLNVILERTLHDRFKAATAAQGKRMTDVLLAFIRDYVERHGVKPSRERRR